MNRDKIIQLILLAVFILSFVYQLFPKYPQPEEVYTHAFFPLHEQKMTWCSYVWAICNNLSYCGLFLCFFLLSNHKNYFYDYEVIRSVEYALPTRFRFMSPRLTGRDLLRIELFLKCGYFVEFFFNYNNPWGYFLGVPINFDSAFGGVLVFFNSPTIYELIKRK